MTDRSSESNLTRIEPDDRLVVLARTIQVPNMQAETALKDNAANWARFGKACLGQALYRHRSVHQSKSDAPIWSHLELSYFRHRVPANVILDLVFASKRADAGLMRAEILLTTPSSFVLPREWQGSSDQPERKASLEFINVHSTYLDEYRNAMRDFCGPAATKLVAANKYGTFRAMETAAVLYQAPELIIDWNQIHLCELDPDNFHGFGQEFEAALREDSPERTDLTGTFAGLDPMRTVPRWTYNDAIVEADATVAQQGKMNP